MTNYTTGSKESDSNDRRKADPTTGHDQRDDSADSATQKIRAGPGGSSRFEASNAEETPDVLYVSAIKLEQGAPVFHDDRTCRSLAQADAIRAVPRRMVADEEECFYCERRDRDDDNVEREHVCPAPDCDADYAEYVRLIKHIGEAHPDIATLNRKPESDVLVTDGGQICLREREFRADGGVTVTDVETGRATDQITPTDLTLFQQEMLYILAAEGPEYGLAIKRSLSGRYDGEVNHGRLYPNLDELVDMGLVAKGELDKRTNSYALTVDGIDLLVRDAGRRGRIVEALDRAEVTH